MTATPINLRRARKAKARQAARRQADANALHHGVPGAVRSLVEARQARARAAHDGHRLTGGVTGRITGAPGDDDDTGRD